MAPKRSRGIKGEQRRAVSTGGKPLDIHVLHFGDVEWFRLEDFARLMDMYDCRKRPNLIGARLLLQNLGVPLVNWSNGETYFQFDAFEKAAYFVSRYGGPGFLAPGQGNYERDAQERPRKITSELWAKHGAAAEEDLALLRLRKAGAKKAAVVKQAKAAGQAFIRQMEQESGSGGKQSDDAR